MGRSLNLPKPRFPHLKWGQFCVPRWYERTLTSSQWGPDKWWFSPLPSWGRGGGGPSGDAWEVRQRAAGVEAQRRDSGPTGWPPGEQVHFLRAEQEPEEGCTGLPCERGRPCRLHPAFPRDTQAGTPGTERASRNPVAHGQGGGTFRTWSLERRAFCHHYFWVGWRFKDKALSQLVSQEEAILYKTRS